MTIIPAVEITNLTKRYGKTTAVNSLNLTIERGQILALLGPNGAGKSTTTEMMLGLTKPDEGSLQVFGQDPITAVRQGYAGAMLQNGSLIPDVKVKTLLSLYHGICAHPLSLARVRDQAELGTIWESTISKLSGGQRQRVRLGLVLLADPQLIILDEPTVGIDVEGRRAFWATMRDFADDGRTIIFATHYLDEADEFANRVVMLSHGGIVADGSSTQIKQALGGRKVSFNATIERDWSSLPGVTAIEVRGSRTIIRTAHSDHCLRALLGYPDVGELEVATPSLDDAFVELTHC
ncbi:MAG: ATP-binding cassette domain-containing protein [Propionibacteriaceae bacterium]